MEKWKMFATISCICLSMQKIGGKLSDYKSVGMGMYLNIL